MSGGSGLQLGRPQAGPLSDSLRPPRPSPFLGFHPLNNTRTVTAAVRRLSAWLCSFHLSTWPLWAVGVIVGCHGARMKGEAQVTDSHTAAAALAPEAACACPPPRACAHPPCGPGWAGTPQIPPAVRGQADRPSSPPKGERADSSS